MLNWRVTIACRAVTISATAGTGSLAGCGAEPWPPGPSTVTNSPSAADIMTPGLVQNVRVRFQAEKTCMP